ncbi:MAG: glyceraldehyde-3-phosphate dehydrogenase [Bacillaceae bacterium]|nr:glyceraldehyde-3-phosphate dehydrogenase [Bacillaceae bacterium]
MVTRIAINGFGRIGRMVFRRAIHDSSVQVVAINASYTPDVLAHLLKYDTVHGTLSDDIEPLEDGIRVNDQVVKLVSNRDPAQLPWKELDIEVVVEATGKFRDREGAGKHLEAGAEKVVITAPGKDVDATIVMGVNEETYSHEDHHVISNASCTTNCLAPVVKVLHEAFEIENGLMTTVHSYTNDQRVLDNPHKDLRRARACGESIIPTSTGAAKAVAEVLPELKGRLNGIALRVPTPNVSIVDLVADVRQNVTVEEVNRVLKEAAEGDMSSYIQFTTEPLVSSDFVGNDHSSIVDGLSTMVIGDNKIKVLAWYDNEWGYSCRVLDLVKYASRASNKKEVTV